MNRIVAQAASLPYRRLPVGGAWNRIQAPHAASAQQIGNVGNLRNGRLGSLRHYPNAVQGPYARNSLSVRVSSHFPKQGDRATRTGTGFLLRPGRNPCKR